MKAYLKRFSAMLLIAAVMTLCFFFVETMLKKTIHMMTVIELPSLSPWTYYAMIMIFVCAVIAIRKP